MQEFLLGEEEFYDQIFADLKVPYHPIALGSGPQSRTAWNVLAKGRDRKTGPRTSIDQCLSSAWASNR